MIPGDAKMSFFNEMFMIAEVERYFLVIVFALFYVLT